MSAGRYARADLVAVVLLFLGGSPGRVIAADPVGNPAVSAGSDSTNGPLEPSVTREAELPREMAAEVSDDAKAAALFVALGGSMDPVPEADPAPPPAPVYEDQYLFADGDLSGYDSGASLASQPFGQRYLSAETIYYESDDDFFGQDTERGARVFWSQETENWGTLDLEVQAADIDSNFVGRESSGNEAVVTFRQSAMPVSEIAVLDTTFGHQRTPISSLLHGGYRYRLPTSVVLGVSGELTGIDRSTRASIGNVGAYRGVRLPRFDDTGGRVLDFAYEQRINDNVELGGELAHLRDDDDIRDHTSALLAARYAPPDGSREYALRVLADDDGNVGIWADSRYELGFLPTLRWGLSYLDPDLVWADLPIANDQIGAYLRADSTNSRFDYSVGYDFLENGLESAAPSSTATHSLFATGNLRLTRAFSIGLSATLASRSISATVDDDQNLKRLNVFAGIGSPLGLARLELFAFDLGSRFELNRRKRSGGAVSMNWRVPERIRLTTELRVENEDDLRGPTRRKELSVLFRYDLFDNVSLGLNTSMFDTSGMQYAEDGGLSLSADARWAINRDWNASLSLNRNRADYEVVSGDPFGVPSLGEAGQTSLWLTVRYERRSGQPYPTFGRTHDGMSGSGSVSGQVFFDENRDSIREASEQAVVGAVVVLDGRYETRTDQLGRYSFDPVPTGAHELRLVTEDLPLPWGLDDESPRRVVVRFRQDTTVAFPLTVMQ